jgi:predicted dinucleotide-binding enzyme
MDIGIIGSGNMGRVLARHLAAAGHQVRLGNSRGPEAVGAGPELGGALPATVADAARASAVVFLAVPYKAVDDVVRQGGDWRGKVVVDLTNYYPQRDGAALDPGPASSSVVVARKLPGTRVVKAFNTIYFKRLAEESRPEGPERLAVFYAGDDAEANELVAALIRDTGFAPVFTGSLEEGGRRQQPGSDIYNVPLTQAAAEQRLA